MLLRYVWGYAIILSLNVSYFPGRSRKKSCFKGGEWYYVLMRDYENNFNGSLQNNLQWWIVAKRSEPFIQLNFSFFKLISMLSLSKSLNSNSHNLLPFITYLTFFDLVVAALLEILILNRIGPKSVVQDEYWVINILVNFSINLIISMVHF